MNLNWLKSASSGSNPVKELRKHEPGVTSLALENHWKQARDVMLQARDAESVITVISHFNQMISFLRISRNDPSSWHKCKEFWMKNRCSDRAIKWLHDLGSQRCDKDDLKLVHTLQALLELASEDGQLLGYVLSRGDVGSSSKSCDNDIQSESWDGACSLSTILLELCISIDTRISEAARKSFVLLIQLASKYPELECSISQEARLGVTNMTISGLSACFAQLPTFCPATNEQLQPFIEQLHFVDSVVKAATDVLAVTISECFSKNFLYAVILPALTQDEGSRSLHTRDDQNDFVRSLHEEIAVVTSYLQIVCENISHPLLTRSLITFVLTQLLNTLLHRMNHPCTAVTVATLSLLNVLLEYYCEDLWYEIILRHLMPQNHLMVSQRYHRLPNVDFQEAALRFISLLPTSVTDVLGPETVSQNFMQYVDSEVVRWSTIDGISHPSEIEEPNVSLALNKEQSVINSAIPCSLKEDNEEVESTNTISSTSSHSKSSPNAVYPSWKHKYDGTDKLDGTSIPRSLVNLRSNSVSSAPSPPESGSSLTNFKEDLAKGNEVECRQEIPVLDPLSEDKFTTVSLQGSGANDEMNSIGIGMAETSFDSEIVGSSNGTSGQVNNKRFDTSTNDQSDGYSSMESGVIMESVASFGPFVDCLFNHLANFSKLDPDVVLMVTELVSTLAASRIPLISSLFLDHNITLQPSFRSFLLILNRVRLELDKSVRSQQGLVTEIWGQLTREVARLEQETNSPSSSHLQSFTESNSFHSSFGENFTDSLRSKINSKAFVAAVSAVFQRKPVPGHNENLQESIQSVGGQAYRYLAGRPGSGEHGGRSSNPIQEANKIQVTRAIYFMHWLLELSAIATQLCWRRETL